MAQVLYIDPDAVNGPPTAASLGCGWMPAVPAQYVTVAVAPCVILDGNGITTVIAAPTTNAVVAAALAPIVTAEANAAAAQAVLVANGQTLQQRAQNALTTNATFLAIASPTNAQTLAQVQALTKECNGIIRLLLGQLDATTGT